MFKVNQYFLMLRFIVCETVVDSRKVINLCERLFFFLVSRIDIGPKVSSSQPDHNQKPCCFLIVKYHSHRGLERVKVSMIHNSPQKAGPDFWWMWSQKNHVGCIKHSMECQTKISCYVYSIMMMTLILSVGPEIIKVHWLKNTTFIFILGPS